MVALGSRLQLGHLTPEPVDDGDDQHAQDGAHGGADQQSAGSEVIIDAEQGQDRRIDHPLEERLGRSIEQEAAHGEADRGHYQGEELAEDQRQAGNGKVGVQDDQEQQEEHQQPRGLGKARQEADHSRQ